MGSDRLHISLQTVGRVDSFRETNGAAVHDIRHTLPLLTLNNYSITKVFRQLLLKPSACIARYLLRNIKTEIEELPMSEHENAFDQFVSTIQEHLLIHKKVFYLKHLLEKFVPIFGKVFRRHFEDHFTV
jgi:hypothetical protein